MVYSEQTHACKSGIQDCDCNTFHFPDMILRYFWFLKKVISVVADDSTGKWKSKFPTLPMLGSLTCFSISNIIFFQKVFEDAIKVSNCLERLSADEKSDGPQSCGSS